MQSWRLLQLEPSSLRQPDPFTAPTKLAADGSHLAATLYRLARASAASKGNGGANGTGAAQVFSRIANRLGELIDDVRAVSVDREERRELLTLNVTGGDGTIHPARALSDGTLRFLALTLLELDPEATGLLCLEEPENGIHPDRIPAMLRLLKDIATDTTEPLGDDNPLRQVIINTHSPAVVGEVDDDDILIAELKEELRKTDGIRYRKLSFSCLSNTWRADTGEVPIAQSGAFLPYLNPNKLRFGEPVPSRSTQARRKRRVAEREDLQLGLSLGNVWVSELRFTLLSDGGSDRALIPILRWALIENAVQCSIQPSWADLRHLRKPARGLANRIAAALEYWPCDLLFIHRDAEGDEPQSRRQEIDNAVQEVFAQGRNLPRAVFVVPVRMLEAWFLTDLDAIREAAGNPGGSQQLEIPNVQSIETLPDPKNLLYELLRDASGLSGRRRRKMQVNHAVHRIGQVKSEFNALRALNAFRRMEEDLRQVIGECGWGAP
jgi:hypothetical protein